MKKSKLAKFNKITKGVNVQNLDHLAMQINLKDLDPVFQLDRASSARQALNGLLAGIYSNPEMRKIFANDPMGPKVIAGKAVAYADALIDRLKK